MAGDDAQRGAADRTVPAGPVTSRRSTDDAWLEAEATAEPVPPFYSGGAGERGATEPGADRGLTPSEPEAASGVSGGSGSALTELARRLAAFARRVDREGWAAVEHELADGDRFEAAVAGLVIGHLSGGGRAR